MDARFKSGPDECVCVHDARSFNVVPANAGTHTTRPRVFCTVVKGFLSNKHLWLWVPAFPGTTVERRVTDSNFKQPSCHKHSFAISPRIRASCASIIRHLNQRAQGMPGARCA